MKQLHVAMIEAKAALVFSVNHAWDFYPRTDQATKDRIAGAFDAFSLVLVPNEEPHIFEKAPGGPHDLDLRRADIAELLNHHEATRALSVLDPVTEIVREAEQASLEAARATPRPFKKAEFEMYVQVLVGVITGTNGIDAGDLLRFWEERNGRAESPETRDAIIGQLQPIAEMLKQLRVTFPDLDGDDLIKMVRDNEDPRLALERPGIFFQRALRNGRRQNVTRNSKRSDLVDLQHVQFLPYVDVLTTDRENVAVLVRALPQARCGRSAKLMRNGDLNGVIMELRRQAELDTL